MASRCPREPVMPDDAQVLERGSRARRGRCSVGSHARRFFEWQGAWMAKQIHSIDPTDVGHQQRHVSGITRSSNRNANP
jgi:hypothetical protein